jgi:hypothetical protein
MNVPPNGTMETNGQQELVVDADSHEDAIIMAIEQNELEGDLGDTLAIWVTPTPEDPASVGLLCCMTSDETEWFASTNTAPFKRPLTEEEKQSVRDTGGFGMFQPKKEKKPE